tara:strand:+ start:98 stop:532 length:435 start_codon:yes stop_codon:yes gene_type:complete
MKNIYLIILSFICFYSHSQFESTEDKQRWEVLGSKKDGSVFLKLRGSNFYKFSFKNHQFSDNKTIKSIELNLLDVDIDNLYNFFLNSFDLTESRQSSIKIDKYEFQVLKNGDFIRVSVKLVNSNETIGWMPLSIRDLNDLFGKY